MENPKVSIIMCTYNRSEFLPDAINSVLTQSFTGWEFFIVDDCSTDNTKEVVASFAAKDSRIIYLRNEVNLKMCKSRNRALELAKGKYVAILDSDDQWSDADKLKKQVEFLNVHDDYVLIGGGVIVVDKQGKEIKRYLNIGTEEAIKKSILVKNPFAHSSVMFRTQPMHEAGGFNIDMLGIEDYELYLKIGVKWKMENLQDYVLKYRVHGGNISIIDRYNLMKKNLYLVNLHKNDYPNYCRAWLRRTTRLVAYKLLSRFVK